jgi:hypothetical protein
MDSLMTQLARELSEAVSAAVAADARVEACRETARAGLEMSAIDRRFLKSLRIAADEPTEKEVE